MDLKLISKNNVGTAVLFLLVIALSQAKAFNFLIDTALGRFFLIICIVGLSYSHKIIGVVGVLFVIIMFNSNMYYEGFGNKSKSDDDSSNDDSSDSNTQLDEDQIKAMIKEQIAEAAKNKASSENSSDDSSDNSSDKSKKFKASEGFDVLGMENSIKRGKQSNSIPVNNFMRDSDSISPYEGSSILGNFSPF
jgi:hypothetical protein